MRTGRRRLLSDAGADCPHLGEIVQEGRQRSEPFAEHLETRGRTLEVGHDVVLAAGVAGVGRKGQVVDEVYVPANRDVGVQIMLMGAGIGSRLRAPPSITVARGAARRNLRPRRKRGRARRWWCVRDGRKRVRGTRVAADRGRQRQRGPMDEWPARSPLAPAAPKTTPHDPAHRTCESGSLIEFPILRRVAAGIIGQERLSGMGEICADVESCLSTQALLEPALRHHGLARPLHCRRPPKATARRRARRIRAAPIQQRPGIDSPSRISRDDHRLVRILVVGRHRADPGRLGGCPGSCHCPGRARRHRAAAAG